MSMIWQECLFDIIYFSEYEWNICLIPKVSDTFWMCLNLWFKDSYISQQTWNQANFPSGCEKNVNDFHNEAEHFYIS